MVSGSQCSPGICKPMTIKKEHQEGAVTPHLSDKGPTWADKTWTCICSGESKWSSLTGRMVQARGGWVITWTQSVRRTTIRARSWHLILLAVSYALLIPLSLFYLSYFLPVLKKKKKKKAHQSFEVFTLHLHYVLLFGKVLSDIIMMDNFRIQGTNRSSTPTQSVNSSHFGN